MTKALSLILVYFQLLQHICCSTPPIDIFGSQLDVQDLASKEGAHVCTLIHSRCFKPF